MNKSSFCSREWFSDNSFWENYAALLFDKERWEEAPGTAASIIAMAGIAKNSPILDMCCGPGRHALAMAEMTYKVVGVDITEAFIVAARDSADAMGLKNTEFINADARTWKRPGAFSLAINLFTSFGYFDSMDEDLQMLKRLYESLAHGGVLIMELKGKEIAARDFMDGEWFERDGKTVLTQFEVQGAWEAIKHRWIIMDGMHKIDRCWIQRLYSAQELKTLLEYAGFKNISFFGSFDGSPYNQEALTMVARAVKL
ncbi:class I SAM-dependent methyltransferase [Spirochaetota bacterium]